MSIDSIRGYVSSTALAAQSMACDVLHRVSGATQDDEKARVEAIAQEFLAGVGVFAAGYLVGNGLVGRVTSQCCAGVASAVGAVFALVWPYATSAFSSAKEWVFSVDFKGYSQAAMNVSSRAFSTVKEGSLSAMNTTYEYGSYGFNQATKYVESSGVYEKAQNSFSSVRDYAVSFFKK